MVKFADLDDKDYPGTADQRSYLDDWYRSVRREEISELAVADLARAVRQQLFIEHTLPRAIELVSHELLVGADYDGQLLHAICEVDGDGLKVVDRLKADLMPLLVRAIESPTATSELRSAAMALRKRLLTPPTSPSA